MKTIDYTLKLEYVYCVKTQRHYIFLSKHPKVFYSLKNKNTNYDIIHLPAEGLTGPGSGAGEP